MSFGGGEEENREVQTSQQVASFPEELKPYISDILTRGQTRFEEREEEGFQPYTGARLAEFTPEMLQAREGLTGLVNNGLSSNAGLSSAKTYFEPALGFASRAGKEWDADAANQYMSPYMQSVVDIEKREAERVGDVQAQQIGDAAVKTGGFGGSRQAIREAEQARNENQLQADIQTKGSQDAYDRGLSSFQNQRQRDMGLAGQLQTMGTQAYNQAVTEQGQLAKVGEQSQAQNQRGLDLEYQKFLDEKTAPDRALQDYSGLVRGYYMAPDTGTTKTTQGAAPALGTQLLGAAATGAGIYNNLFKKEGGRMNEGGLVALASGGTIKHNTSGTLYAGENIMKPDDVADADVKAAAVAIVEDSKKKNIDPTPRLTAMYASLDAGKAKRETKAVENEKQMKRDKWMELAKFGTNVMKAGGEGKGILSAAGAAGAESLEGLQAIDAGGRAFADKQDAAAAADLRTGAALETAEFNAQRDYELKLKELAIDAAEAGQYDMKHLPTPGDMNMWAQGVAGKDIMQKRGQREIIDGIQIEIMNELANGTLKYNGDPRSIKTVVHEELRKRITNKGLSSKPAGKGGGGEGDPTHNADDLINSL